MVILNILDVLDNHKNKGVFIKKLEVINLCKIFGEHPSKALKLLKSGVSKDEIFKKTGQTVGVYDCSFSVNEGEIFVIMGLSGSGKSTLVRMLNRLIDPTDGEVFINGTEITKLNDKELRSIRRKEISMVFQSFALMPHMNVLDNVAFGLEMAGIDKKTRHKTAMEALRQVGLEVNAHAFPDELSGGMQQRVGLARGLANNPQIMLMDEAFSALDPLIRSEMQDELLKLQEEQQRTIIFISHDLDEAMKLGDRIAIMEGGRIIQIGTPDEILHNPANDYVRSFFQGVNVGGIFTAKDILSRQHVHLIQKEGTGTRAALQRLHTYDRDYGFVVTKSKQFKGVVSIDSLKSAESNNSGLDSAIIPDIPTLNGDDYLNVAMSVVASAPCGVPVVDNDGKFLGVVTKASLLEALSFDGGEA